MRDRIEKLLARIEDDELREEFRRELERGGELKPRKKPRPIFIVMDTLRIYAGFGKPPVKLRKGTILFLNKDNFLEEEGGNRHIPLHFLRWHIESGRLKSVELDRR